VASAFTHAVFAVGLGTAFCVRVRPLRFWLLGAACAALPDLDVIAFLLGIPYEAPLGHRGASHSLVFAALLAVLFTAAVPRAWRGELSAARMAVFLFLATASHGLLDALTDGGLGVAFFWPLDDSRYFLPWRPLEVSPIGVGAFLGARGAAILANEMAWVWLPTALFAAACVGLRRRRSPHG
jgi:inner membrane protein